MKAITEFASFTLTKALAEKASLTAEGKSPEEIEASLGTKFKLEGDKLKHFIKAMEVTTANPENLKRILVVSLAEGETAPPKAVKNEETYYVPETWITTKQVVGQKPAPRERGGKGGKGGPGNKKGGSPWGMSPEEKAAKNQKGSAPKPS